MEVNANKTKIYAVINFAILAASGYLMQVIINKGFGLEGLGEFNSALAYFLVASLITTMGTNFAVLSFVSSDNMRDKVYINSILKNAFKLTHLGFLLVFLGTVILVYLFNLNYLLDGEYLIYLSVGTLFFAYNKIILALINAINRMTRFYVLQSLRYVLLLIFTTVVVLYSDCLSQVSFVFVATELTLFIFLIITERKNINLINIIDHQDNNLRLKSEFRLHSIKALPSGVVQELSVRIDIIMLTIMSTGKNVGYYSIAAMISEGLNQVLVVWRDSLSPKFIQMQDLRALQKFIGKTLTTSIASFAVLLTVVYLFYQPVLSFMFGSDVTEHSKDIFGILGFGLILALPFTVLQLLPNQLKKPEVMSRITLIGLAINVIFNYLLIPGFGIYGAAIATALAYFSSSVLLLFWIKKYF